MEIGTDSQVRNTQQINRNEVSRMPSLSLDKKESGIDTKGHNDKKDNSKDNKSIELQEKTIINAIEEANKKLLLSNTQLEFSVHERTKRIMIKVVDKESDKIIREIPSEKTLDMVATMCEGAGILVDEKV